MMRLVQLLVTTDRWRFMHASGRCTQYGLHTVGSRPCIISTKMILMMLLRMLLGISGPSSNARRPHHERRHILVPLQHFLDFLQRKALLKRYIMSTIIESTSRCFQWYCASNCNRSHRHVSSGYPQGYLDCRELFGIDDGFTTGIALGCSYTIHCTTYDANTRMVS